MLTLIKKIFSIFVLKRLNTIKCPYIKEPCTEYDYSSGTFRTQCDFCKNYNNGIQVSKL